MCIFVGCLHASTGARGDQKMMLDTPKAGVIGSCGP